LRFIAEGEKTTQGLGRQQGSDGMLKARSRWDVSDPPIEAVAALQEELNLSSLAAKVLAARGFGVKEAYQFLDIQSPKVHDPFLMKGMDEAVDRIIRAIQQQEKIRVYGDYDCDGVTSTAIMVKTLNRLGGRVDYYIPNRFSEGYGLNKKALEQAKNDEIGLLITVDTGISGWEEVTYATALGLDCIVTDHHEPPQTLPRALSVINPKQPGCSYPFQGLSGAGVALKVAQALLREIPDELLELAAIGTIADLVPLVDENRWIAASGLVRLNQTNHVGLQKLIDQSGLGGQWINEHHVGYILGPRINACGRLQSAWPAVELLLTEDHHLAGEISQQIERLNTERQELVHQIFEEAVAMAETQHPQEMSPRVLVVAKEGWHEGVLGIVASKLVERYYRPALVFSIDPESGLAKGSARSIDGFDLYRALEKCSKWLAQFGGHPMAAGLTVNKDHLAPLKEQLNRIALEWLTEELLKPRLKIDAVCSVEELTVEAIEELEKLAPFGEGNPPPVLLVEGATLADMRQIGKQGEHLKCLFKLGRSRHNHDSGQGGAIQIGPPEAIGFGWGDTMKEISSSSKVDVAGRLVVNQWNGRLTPQVQIADLRINHRQFFDWRGKGDLISQLAELPKGSSLCYFRHQPVDAGHAYHAVFVSPDGTPDSWPDSTNILLYDLPISSRQLEQFCQNLKQAERIYVLFRHQDHYFSTWPTREHFKWYYAFLKQRGSFDLKNQGPKLAKHKGWTVDTLTFMTEVFLDLKFVTMNGDRVQVLPNPEKKPLTHSALYRQRQAEYELEQTLIYSTQGELIDYLSRLIDPTYIERNLREDKAYGF
jgi:single-stranded-DNA-specific exonuclease